MSDDLPDVDDRLADAPGTDAVPTDPVRMQATRSDMARDPGNTMPRYSRRLSDKILISFHQACDQSDYEVARKLLDVFEFMLLRREVPADSNRRRSLDSLVAAHERLWHLRHPEQR